MKGYNIIFKLRCDNDVVYNIETGVIMEASQDDWYFEHKALVEAMNILVAMADELKEGNKIVTDFKIKWEE